METDEVTLWCYVERRTDYIPVSIPSANMIHDLKNKLSSITGYNALDIFLMKIDADLRDVLRELESNGQYRPADARRLGPHERISDIWSGQPPSDHLHVFVRLPSGVSTAGGAHAEWPEPDDYDKLIELTTTSSFVCQAPSHVAKPSEFRMSQAKEGRILNDRPSKDVRVPPIALLYAPFGQFLDHLRDRPEEQPGVDLRDFQLAVDEFASVMCEHFKEEDERRDKALSLLNAIFRCYHPFTLPPLDAAVIAGKRSSDGHAIGPAELMETVLEFKNEFGSGQTDPEIQTTSYYLQMFHRLKDAGRYKHAFEKYLCPMLVITVIGSYIGFGALVLLNNARFVALTPLLPARSPSGDDIHRSTLFHAFRAACVLRHSIHEDTQRVIDSTTLTRIHRRSLPYVQEIPAWPLSENRQLEFRILEVAYQGEIWNENRFLFHAKAQNEDVLVKFTRRYSTDLHSFCAERGHAPKLLGYGTIPGGWKVVAMEYVGHYDDYAPHAPENWAKWGHDLTNLVQDFHEKKLVHGDLRTPNIIVPVTDPANIMLVDFDWGGEAERVSFPTWSINQDLIDGDKLESLLITKEHDVRVLAATLERLRPVTAAMVVDTS